MLDFLTAAALVLASAAAVMLVVEIVTLRRARKLHKRALERWRRIRHDYVASKLERHTFDRGARSRDGEVTWFALKWEGEHERAEEYASEVARLRAQYVEVDQGKIKRDKTKIQIERDTRYGE